MAWVRIDDGFAEHPKLLATTYPALTVALQVAALCYCNRNLTDGFIPAVKVPGLLPLGDGLAPGGDRAVWEVVVEDLLELGIWEPVKGGYSIHDYLEYQPSRADAMAIHRKRSEAGKAGAVARWTKGQVSDGKDGKPIANDMAKSWPEPVPVPDIKPNPHSNTVGGEDVATVRRASGTNTVTTKAARAVIGEYGYDVALAAARSLMENVPPGGVRSPDALFRKRAADMEPPPPPLPKRVKCGACGGGGYLLTPENDAAVKCPECEGRGYE